MIRIFSGKSGSVIFHHLSLSNSMPKIFEILSAVIWESCLVNKLLNKLLFREYTHLKVRTDNMAWRPLVSPLGLCLLRLASWLTFQYFETSLKRSDSFNFSPSLTSGLLSLLRLQKTTKTWIFRILTAVKTCKMG